MGVVVCNHGEVKQLAAVGSANKHSPLYVSVAILLCQ